MNNQNSSSEKINNESNGSVSHNDNVTNINQLRSNKKMTLIHRISV